MGAWGVSFTENDGALDFLDEIGDSRDWNEIGRVLREFVDEGEYENAEQAFAACELVAAALGKPSPYLEEDLSEWAMEQSADAMVLQPVALKVAGLIGTESELNDLWSEADEYAEWQASVEDLKSRLG